MKKLLLAFALTTILASCAIAQSTVPRFGITKNNDNTGRVLTYGYLAPTQSATMVITPGKYDNLYALNTLTLSPVIQFTATAGYLGDRVTIIALASGATRTITMQGSVLYSASTFTIADGKKSTIQFIFDGAKYVETARTTNN